MEQSFWQCCLYYLCVHKSDNPSYSVVYTICVFTILTILLTVLSILSVFTILTILTVLSILSVCSQFWQSFLQCCLYYLCVHNSDNPSYSVVYTICVFTILTILLTVLSMLSVCSQFWQSFLQCCLILSVFTILTILLTVLSMLYVHNSVSHMGSFLDALHLDNVALDVCIRIHVAVGKIYWQF